MANEVWSNKLLFNMLRLAIVMYFNLNSFFISSSLRLDQ